MTEFRFKRFVIQQDQCAMKVGTDGVLLGAWVNVDTTSKVLDIGTGTGLIALMVAQRNANCTVLGIDIDSSAVGQARSNVALSTFRDRVDVKQADARGFAEEVGFDLIVSNPPYFNGTYAAKGHKRNIARQQGSLQLNDLVDTAQRLGTSDHSLALILPTEVAEHGRSTFENGGYFLQRECHIRPTPEKSSKRLLQQWSKVSTSEIVSEELVIELARHKYTETYRELCSEFYLNF